MTERLERPKFMASFFAALSQRAENKTLLRMFVAPTIAAIVGLVVAYFLPDAFWQDKGWEVSTTVYSGVLTLNGLILALSWSAFSRIFESLGAPKFCSFLRRNNLLNNYIVTISFIHGLQLFAIVASAAGLISILFDFGYPLIDRAFFGTMVFASIYAIQQGGSAVTIMNDLLWQKSVFDEYEENKKNPNVHPIGRKD